MDSRKIEGKNALKCGDNHRSCLEFHKFFAGNNCLRDYN